MATFDDDLLSEEDLDNIDNNNEGDHDIDESSSNNEEMVFTAGFAPFRRMAMLLFPSILFAKDNLETAGCSK